MLKARDMALLDHIEFCRMRFCGMSKIIVDAYALNESIYVYLSIEQVGFHL